MQQSPRDGLAHAGNALERVQQRAGALRVQYVTEPDGDTVWAEGPPCETCGSPSCSCPLCHGAEWVLTARYDPSNPGKSQLVPCNCSQERIKTRRLGGSGLEALRSTTFATLDDRPEQRQAVLALREWVQNPTGWIWLHGPSGGGKTTLAVCAGNAVAGGTRSVMFRLTSDLLRHINAGINVEDPRDNYEARIQAVMDTDILILDDYGRHRASDSAEARLFDIFNNRWINRRPLIVTTNKHPNDLEPGVRSRMSDPDICQTIEVLGQDGRLRRKEGAR